MANEPESSLPKLPPNQKLDPLQLPMFEGYGYGEKFYQLYAFSSRVLSRLTYCRIETVIYSTLVIYQDLRRDGHVFKNISFEGRNNKHSLENIDVRT